MVRRVTSRWQQPPASDYSQLPFLRQVKDDKTQRTDHRNKSQLSERKGKNVGKCTKMYQSIKIIAHFSLRLPRKTYYYNSLSNMAVSGDVPGCSLLRVLKFHIQRSSYPRSGFTLIREGIFLN